MSTPNVDNYNDNNNVGGSGSTTDIAITMAGILGTLIALIGGLIMLQTPATASTTTTTTTTTKSTSSSVLQACLATDQQPSKRSYELFVAFYTPIWIGAFAIIVAFQLYEDFTAWTYIGVCGGLALPFLLQPVLLPGGGDGQSPDRYRPLLQRYSMKANLWIAIYSFIGNYWYTHYFYSVLQASYSMPAHRLNNVPIAMFMATHFYFSTYHFFSNCLLRAVTTLYSPVGMARSVLFVSVIGVFSYFTAFMETLTISAYPYYSFQDRNMAYTVGSAFYGIYFIVSFPAFFYFDDQIDVKNGKVVTAWDTIVSSCGYGMMILFLLDFVRLYLDIPLVVGTSDLHCVQH